MAGSTTVQNTRVVAAVLAAALLAGVWVVRVGIHLPGGHAGSSAAVLSQSSRALGITALVLACATLPLGLVVGRRLFFTGARRVELRAAHRVVALGALAATALHLATLFAASSLAPSVADLFVPFVWRYRTIGTALGVLAMWVLVALGLSYYARRRVGAARWRVAHRFIAIGLALALVHTIAGG
jgi:sulfoxide reductase heme-binding subunit YedZ